MKRTNAEIQPIKLNQTLSRFTILFSLFGILVLASCGEDYLPKPRGYFRIDLPVKNYQLYQSQCPLEFEAPSYSKVQLFTENGSADSCWFNIIFPKFNARIYCTYLPVNNNITELADDAYQFAFKHEMKADAIQRTYFDDKSRGLYGIMYDIEGEAASQVQFFLTDSTKHYLRGALYFDNRPNQDSLAPVLDFIRQDIVRITETLRWK
ncbi:MAG: gliding motility lipoprotein GldD [Flavobacteriales bacterium]|nr:gliding motility lipoprotein GldD [Flavobacteriales bacterium]